MKRILRTLTAIALLCASALAYGVEFRRAQPNLDDVFGASCRVSVEGARGSGLFVYYQGEKAYVLTNYHVVQNNATAKLDFWTNHTRQTVDGRVIKRFSDRRANLDFAIIEVDTNELKRIDPPYIPLAPVDPNALTGRKIYAAGGPKGWFVQSWKGANERVEDGLVLFSPHPVPGQSGSGVCSIIDGQIYAVEVLTYLLGDENSDSSKGGALPVLYLANALKGKRQDFGMDLEKMRPIPVADSAPSLEILAFTTDDCPACRIGEVGLSSFEDTGGVVRRVDPNKPENAHYIAEYNITETPTYFVVDSAGNTLVRIPFSEIQKSGAVAAVRYAVASATTPRPSPQEKPRPKPTPAPTKEVADDIRLDADHGVIISDVGEPKKTLPVYVTDPQEYAYDMRQPVYDDSGASVAFDLFSNWRDRDQDGGNTKGKENGSAPPSDSDECSQLGDRIAERLANALAPKIEDSVKSATQIISQNIQDAITSDDSPIAPIKKELKHYALKLALLQVALFLSAQIGLFLIWKAIRRICDALYQIVQETYKYNQKKKG